MGGFFAAGFFTGLFFDGDEDGDEEGASAAAGSAPPRAERLGESSRGERGEFSSFGGVPVELLICASAPVAGLSFFSSSFSAVTQPIGRTTKPRGVDSYFP